MTEAHAIEELVEFTGLLLHGISVVFTIVYVHVIALNYFIGQSPITIRVLAFLFVCLILCLIVAVILGAQATQSGLIEDLRQIEVEGHLSHAGRAALTNAAGIDGFVRFFAWVGLAAISMALAYLTFFHRWGRTQAVRESEPAIAH